MCLELGWVHESIAAPRRIALTCTNKPPTQDEIIERLVYPVINEAALCLAEGIALKPDDVDLAMVFGTGFAPFRGGPLRYAESVGIQQVVNRLIELSKSHPHLAPCEALKAFAVEGSFTTPENVDSESEETLAAS